MIVAQVIDAVIAVRLIRGPGDSSPTDAAVSAVIPVLDIVAMSASASPLASAAGARVICADMTLPHMPYSKRALLLFGGGLVLGLIVVSADLPVLGWVANLAAAAGIALLPIALVVDWWSHRPWKTPARKSLAGSRRKRATESPAPRKRAAKGK
jgi:hypothetical protein